jgi:hypothetical protein
MPSLTTLEEIKARLGALAAGVNPERDAMLDAYRVAVEERILALTGFSFTGGIQTEEQIDVQLGVSRLMTLRPILPMSTDPTRAVKLEARSLASATFATILGDVRNAYDGRIMPLASELTPVFPPIGGQAPWVRWRQMIWPTVKFTYIVDPLGSATNPIPASLNRAAVEWTVFIAGRPFAGLVQSYSAEKISETFFNHLKTAQPPVVQMLLAKYTRNQASMVF